MAKPSPEYEELFDAFRQVVSERDTLAAVGDSLWNEVPDRQSTSVQQWEALRGIGAEPPTEEFRDWLSP